jgi:hypothetical protein
MSLFARFSSPSVHEAIMASARDECKRPMHVHPHVFQFETTTDPIPPGSGSIEGWRTVFDGALPEYYVLTN